MLSGEKGVLPGSDYYFMTPSVLAQEIFFYPLFCGHFRCITGYDVRRIDYNNFLLMYVAQGQCGIEAEGREFVARTGDLVILDCHKPHRYYAIDYLDLVWLHFDGHDAENFYRQIVRSSGIVCSVGEDSEIVSAIREFLILYRNNQRLGEAESSWKIYRALCLLLTQSSISMTARQHDSIDQALVYIDQHLGMDINLEDVARHVNMSMFHFSRLFKKKIGQSPYHFILTSRIDRAKILLKSTSLTVKEIARMIGFNSETNFISTFSSRVGIPPQKFREFPL